MISVWEEGIEERQPRVLRKDQSCQVLILGGSLTGLLTALFCKAKGYDAIVLEEETLERRALEIDFFDKIHDFKTWAYSIWYTYLSVKYKLKCHLKRIPAFYYWLAQKPTANMPKQPVFHPLKWMLEVASHVTVFEQVSIQNKEEQQLITEAAYVKYEYLIDLRKKEQGESENWVAVSGVNLKQGIYICMDSDANFLTWKDKIIMRDSYRFLFPKGDVENQWSVNPMRKESIYQSMDRARKQIKKLETVQFSSTFLTK